MAIEPTSASNPGAGFNISVVVAAGKTQILRSLAFQFTTSATVADRYVRLAIGNPTQISTYYWGENNVAQVAGVTCAYSLALGHVPVPTPPATNATVRAFSLPLIILRAGWNFATITPGLDAGDTFFDVYYELQDVNTTMGSYI